MADLRRRQASVRIDERGGVASNGGPDPSGNEPLRFIQPRDYTMSKDSKTTTKGRDAGSGRFIPVEQARRNPSTSVVERVPKPGRGDTGSGKKK